MKRNKLYVFDLSRLALLFGLASVSLFAEESRLLPKAEFPLGRMELPETREIKLICPGVTHVHVERGQSLRGNEWAIVSRVLTDESAITVLRECLEHSGLRVQEDWFQAPLRKERYCLLSAGEFSSQGEAKERLAKLVCRAPLQVRNRASMQSWTTGPWTLDLVIIDPAQYHGSIVSARGTGLSLTSQIARSNNAIVGINGSFFNGYVGPRLDSNSVPYVSGSSIIQGQWYNQPDDGPVLFIENGEAGPKLWIEKPQGSIPLPVVRWSNGEAAPLTGINRIPKHANELIALRPEIFAYWQKEGNIPNEVLAVWVAKGGRLSPLDETQALGTEDLVLLGTGNWREKLRAALANGEHLGVSLEILGRPGLNAFRGVPILVRGGRPIYEDWRQGRAARTAVGTDASGKIYLLTIDGKQYESLVDGTRDSVGASLSELREIMRFLGAVDAINIDGGGSSVMVINGEVVSRPYEPFAPNGNHRVERRILDALLLLN